MRYGQFETPSFNNTNPANLLTNGDFKHWSAGDNVAPDGWNLWTGSPSSTIAKESTIVKLGAFSAALVANSDHAALQQTPISGSDITYWQGRTVTLGGWAWSDNPGSARFIFLHDGIDDFSSSFHTGDGTWQWLTVTATINIAATVILVQLAANGTAPMYFDGIILVEGTSAFAFGNKPARSSLNGVVDPTTVTPDFIGQVYVNTAPAFGATGVFISNGLNEGDWVTL